MRVTPDGGFWISIPRYVFLHDVTALPGLAFQTKVPFHLPIIVSIRKELIAHPS
jgi:hypothetical protein